MKDSLSKSIYLDIGIIAGVLALAMAGLYLLSSDINARAKGILVHRSALATRNINLDTLTQLQKDASTAAGYQAAINQLLSSQDNLINFSQNVSTAGKSFNVNATVDFQGDPVPATADAPGNVGFALRADGTSADLLAFLKNIESQSTQFLLVVDSIDFTVSDPSSRLAATGHAFFQ